jgi:hypothetical protein
MAWINIETIDACIAFGGMLSLPEMNELSGIVMGWVDLPGSLDLGSIAPMPRRRRETKVKE